MLFEHPISIYRQQQGLLTANIELSRGCEFILKKQINFQIQIRRTAGEQCIHYPKFLQSIG
ncbi:unnamed protein product (macronuclear) [Paramecium tetraurelia]|uniref:Uncharacterized protein n=1 Tax=Paramecium tetraurelia TaxID=5888 RepID=A0DSU6_PARTE|nr:uncharacterized protein GSPATT00019806001 [Paramecium tetraurelia]CAK86113.1 unnamed protein product [Paramecium tetraurelia]|eukprot:XP_001453510.1 hypothetical protein (macronuclear) [Paramecium tetraurelia strain d4-2]